MNKAQILFLLLFSTIQNFAQTNIKGKIIDSLTNTAVQSASIRLYDGRNQLKEYTYSDDLGSFSILSYVKGNFTLKISAMGYIEKELSINASLQDVEITVDLVSKPFDLDEVIILADRPIRVKKDTIIFDAKAFAQGNEEVVEDLLKKIPGLNIDSEGTIKIGNKEVEKVMIDGDDFFERGYKILTKNMPASPIDEIEVYQNYSNNRLLKGVEESDKVALNLTLKEDAKRLWFGNLELGYGLFSENRYEVRGNLMNFGKKNKYYFLANLNNTGYDATGDINQLIRPFRIDEPASVGDDQQVNSLIGLTSNPPNFKRSRTNFNNSELFSLNAIFNPSEKLKIKTLAFFNGDENDFFRNSIQTFEANQTNFTNTEDYTLRNKTLTGFGKVDLTYDISKTSSLEAVTKYNSGSTNGTSNLVFNGASTLQRLETNNKLFDQKISYTNKFKEKKVFLLTARFIDESTPQNYSINRFFYENLFPGNQEINNVAQVIENNMQFAGIEAHLLDRRENENLLELQLGNQYRKDNLNSVFQLKQDENILQLPPGFQNHTQYTSNDLYLKSKYQWQVLEDFSLIGKMDLHQLSNKLEYEGFNESENPFFINPTLGLDWKINSKNRLRSSYSINTTNAGILDVYSNFVLTGFRSFQSGTGNFNQLEASTFILNYELGQWSDRFFANTFLVYSKNHDFFSSSSIIEQNYSLSEKTLFKNREYLSINSNMDRYFRFIRSNLKLDLGYVQSNYKNIVNNSGVREINSWNYFYGTELRSGFTGFFNYHLGTKWTTSKIETGTFSNSFTDNLSFLDLSFIFNERFDAQVKTERYFFGNLQAENTYYFLDMDATYQLKPNKFTLSLEARNLFDTEIFRSFTVSDIGTSTTSYRLLPRFALLKLKYRF